MWNFAEDGLGGGGLDTLEERSASLKFSSRSANFFRNNVHHLFGDSGGALVTASEKSGDYV